MATNNEVEIVYGTAGLGRPDTFWTESESNIPDSYKILESFGVKKLDTAHLYTGSEEALGKSGAVTDYDFTIDTKWIGGFIPGIGGVTPEEMLASAKGSLDKLHAKQIDIFYLHAPAKDIPLEQILTGVNDAYKAGIFRRFGLSNFPPAEVQRVYDTAKKLGFVLPTVYQGNYSAVARKQEDVLFPTIRKLGISFYAYSPSAGGFLAKTRELVLAGQGRFNPDQSMGIYYKLYVKDSFLNALDAWGKVAEEEGVSRIELAYRWIRFHSALDGKNGDAIIVGAKNNDQLREVLEFFPKGPLSAKAVDEINAIWKSIEKDALVDNFEAISS